MSAWPHETDVAGWRQCCAEETSRLKPVLRAGSGQKRHHIHGVARKDREVRMAFEHLRGSFMRRRAHDDQNGQLIHNVRNAIARRALGFA